MFLQFTGGSEFGNKYSGTAHRYIAWSKNQGRVAAQGGAIIQCMRDHAHACPIPKSWNYRIEVDFGECWASVKILEFKRETGQLMPGNLEGEDELIR